MGRPRISIALVLALTLVGQGVAFAQASATLPAAPTAAESTMPCHAPAKAAPACCDQAGSCPAMLVCLNAHFVPASMALLPDAARAAPIAWRDAALPITARPPTVFRPPIVISA